MGNSTADGSAFNSDASDRLPLTLPEILSAHRAIQYAAQGSLERPAGVSAIRWQRACNLAREILPGLCWLLGHADAREGRMLDMLVRAAGPITGGLDNGPDSVPGMYQVLLAPANSCAICGADHRSELPHDLTPIYQQWFFSRKGRRPTLEDACAHCCEPVQAHFAAMWSTLGVWPVIPEGWVAPSWFGAIVQSTLAKCAKHMRSKTV